MTYTDRLKLNLEKDVLKFTQSRTKDAIKDLNKKIKFLKKHKSFYFYTVKNHFIDEFSKMFSVEIHNKFGKIKYFYDFLKNVKDSKEDAIEYCRNVQSILSILIKKVHEYHIYAALLHGRKFEKINPKMNMEDFVFIFNRKYNLDLHEFNRSRDSNKDIEIKQYYNLRKHFQSLVDDVLGPDYYNEGVDVYSSDEFSCRDLKEKILSFKVKKLFLD